MEKTHKIIAVAVALPVYDTYSYKVPAQLSHLACTGKRVLVPFGKRTITGYILGEAKSLADVQLKSIVDILDDFPIFPASIVDFYKWISAYYIHPIGEVIKSGMPGGLNVHDVAMISSTSKGMAQLASGDVKLLEKQILSTLGQKPLNLNTVNRQLNKNLSVKKLESMQKKGWIKLSRKLKTGATRTKTQRWVSLLPSDAREKISRPRKKIMAALKSNDGLSIQHLKTIVPTAANLVKKMEKDGQVEIFHRPVYRDPFGEPIDPDVPPELTREQKHAIETISPSLGKTFSPYLLSGVTGSGKTEVYMGLAESVISMGLSVIVLVPEIALISQTEKRFRARFGDCIALLHSSLSRGERYDQWVRILEKKASIVIGARSAVFAPVENLGLIIVDEEHDTSYKQEGALRYNARDTAVMRAKQNQAAIVLGSATPSVQSFNNTESGKFKLVEMKNRVENSVLPDIEVVDLTEFRDEKGIRRFISPRLQTELYGTLEKKDQALLFLNRRGFAAFPVCASCGEAVRCKNCDITLTLHKKTNSYRCHYCGFSKAAVSGCTFCGSNKISLLGLGTERLEEDIRRLFPNARVARLDKDTTTKKGSILKILKDLKEKKTDILIGTQMVAKGHDFPGITLVGIICADLTLNFPDFRSGERTFQLLAQVAGRSGRGEKPGRVILQTYNPEHFSIVTARDQDFNAFYNNEIEFRKILGYPPVTRMIQLKISGKNSYKTSGHAMLLGEKARLLSQKYTKKGRNVDLMGPIEAPLAKIAERHRWQMLVRSGRVSHLHAFVKELLFNNPKVMRKGDIRVDIDVDPVFLM